MSKSNKNFRADDHKYQDGFGVDKRKGAVIDKRKERRFERALKTHNVDELLEDENGEDLDDLWSEGDYKLISFGITKDE